MTTEKQYNTNADCIDGDVKSAVEEIARDLNIKNFEILQKNMDFTGDNYCGDISFVKIKSVQNGSDVDLFVKKGSIDPARRGVMPVNRFFKAEVFTYTNILPAFVKLEETYKIPEEERFLSGKYYKGNSEEFEELIILNDFTKEGFSMNDKRVSFDFEHASLALRNLARIHAFSFVLKRKDPELFSSLIKNITSSFDYEEILMPLFEVVSKMALECVQCPENRAKMEALLNNCPSTMRMALDSSLTEPYSVICHGDCWNNNMLFKYKDGNVSSVVLIDWQLVRYSCPATDIIGVMVLSLDREMLEPHLYSLLDIYHDSLRQQLARMECDVDECYPKEVLKRDVERLFPYGLTLASFELPISLRDPGEEKQMEEFSESEEMPAPASLLCSKRINGFLDYFIRSGFM